MAGDVQPLFREPTDTERTANAMFRNAIAAKAGRPIVQLTATDDAAAQQREQLTGLLDEAESAKKAGNASRLAEVMAKIDKLVGEDNDQPRDREIGPGVTSFGGGVRRQPAAVPDMNKLFLQLTGRVR